MTPTIIEDMSSEGESNAPVNPDDVDLEEECQGQDKGRADVVSETGVENEDMDVATR